MIFEKNKTSGSLQIFCLLLRKCWQVRRRCWITSLIEIVIPVSIISFLWLSFDGITSDSLYIENEIHYESQPLDQLINQIDTGLLTIMYTPSNPFTDNLINNLDECLDNNADFEGFDSKSELIIHTSSEYGDLVAIIFDEYTNDSMKHLHYTFLSRLTLEKYNNLMFNSMTYTEEYYLQVQICLDRSFIEMKTTNTSNKVPQVSIQQFPYPSYTSPASYYSISECVYLLEFVFTIPQFIEVSKVTGEKFAGTNILMSMNGIPNTLNLLSWIISGLLFLSILCVVSVGLLVTSIDGYLTCALCSGNPIILFIFLIAHLAHLITYAIHLSAYISKAFRLVYVLIILNLLTLVMRLMLLELVNHQIIQYAGVVFPIILLAQAADEIDAFEQMGIGTQWRNSFASANPQTEFGSTIGMTVILSVAGTFLHFWLAIYVNIIKPGKFGIKRHPLFFLMRKNKNRECNLSLDEGDPKYFEPPSTRVQTVGIKIQNLNKVYDTHFFNGEKIRALRDVTIDFYKGQITSILGHNGAGKSTFMSIMSGLTKPTDGLILVDSKSLEDKASEVLKDVGFYAQSDICFPTLTVKEQLEFFAMVKKGGESMFTVKSNVASLIRKLKLFEVKDFLPNKLSQDQKRKLCLGIAFVGDPSTLILDEPTSRLDYENKRIIWDTLLEMRGRKTILISTHDMEEADILGDRIAIMHDGRFKSYGTSLYLKKMIAGQSNIEVTLSVERWCDPDKIRHQIDGQTQIIEKQDKKIIIDVPITTTLLGSIENLKRNKKELGVTGIELSHVGLERVFHKVAEDSDRPLKQDEVIIPIEVKRQGIEIQLQSFKALLAENFQYALKDRVTLVTQVFAIILALSVVSMVYRFHLDKWGQKVFGIPKTVNMQLDIYDNPHTLYTSFDENIGNQYRLLSQCFDARSIEISRTNLDSALLQSAKENKIRYKNNLVAAAEFNNSANGSFNVNAFYSQTITFSLPISVNLVSNVIVQSVLGKMWADLISYLTSVVFAIPIYYAIATFAARPSIESANGFKHLQRMTGVSGFTYWAAMFLSDLAQYLFLMLLLLIGLVCIDRTSELPFYGITEIGIMMLLLILLAINILPTIYIFSFIRAKTTFVLKLFTLTPIGLVVAEYTTIFWGALYKPHEDTYFMTRVVSLALPYVSFLHSQIQFHSIGIMNGICKSLPDNFYQVQCEYAGGLCCQEDCQDRSCIKLQPYFLENHIDSLKVCVMYLCVMPIIYFAILTVLESRITQKIWDKVKCRTQHVSKPINDEPLHLEKSIIQQKIQTLKKKRINENIGNPVENTSSFLAYELRKHYGKVSAVEDVSLRVNSSECFGLFGANESGKSTILKMVSGSEVPDHGVMFLGKKHFKTKERDFLSQMGYCPQYDATLKCLNCYDHLRLFARLRGIPEAQVEEEVRTWIGRLNLNAYASQSSGTLSSGNKQRLKLAMALIGNPKFVLLDEPTTYMDPGARRSFWRIVQSCKTAGQTFLLASHDMDECEILCERMAMLMDSKLLCLGTPNELKMRFGAGYDVQIRISSKNTKSQVDRIKKDMRLLLQCVLTNENMGFLMYHVTGAGTTWSKIYGVMENIKNKYDCVDDFLVIVRLSS